MPNLTINILFTIFSGFFISIGYGMFKLYKKFLDPPEDSSYKSQRDYFFIEIYSEKIEPIFINYIKQYFFKFIKNEKSFEVLEDFLKKISSFFKKSNNKDLNVQIKEYYKECLINHINSSKTYESVYTELDNKKINLWFEKFRELTLYSKCISRIRLFAYLNFIFIAIILTCLIIFDIFLNQDLAYMLYLIIIILILIFMMIYILFSYFQKYKPIKKIYHKTYRQKICVKK